MAVECSRLQARIESVPERGPFISKPGNGASSQRRRRRRRRMSYRATKRLIRVPISGPPVPDPGMHAPSNISDLTIADYWMQIDSRVAAGIRRLQFRIRASIARPMLLSRYVASCLFEGTKQLLRITDIRRKWRRYRKFLTRAC